MAQAALALTVLVLGMDGGLMALVSLGLMAPL
jgi:hypothetical protein